MRKSRCFIERQELPALVIERLVRRASSFRQAVRWCWRLRRPQGLKRIDLGREYGFNRQHVSDYLNSDDKPSRRSLPAEQIGLFQEVCGNCFVTQWLAARDRLTVLEQMQADNQRAAA